MRINAAHVMGKERFDFFRTFSAMFPPPGTAPLNNPNDAASCEQAVAQVLNEMKRADGIYFESKVNTEGDGSFFQLELEVDGTEVANYGVVCECYVMCGNGTRNTRGDYRVHGSTRQGEL